MNEQNKTSTRQVIQLILKRFPQVELPDEFMEFLYSQEGTNHLLYRIASGEPLVEFFCNEEVPPHYFSSYLTLDSRLKTKIDYLVLLNLTPEEVHTYLLDQFSHLFHLQKVALDSIYDTGFNLHGIDHLRTVARNAIELLMELDTISVERQRFENETIIGAFFHDVGNLLSRRYHGFYGVYLLTQLFENFDVDDQVLESFLHVLEIVLFHEVEYGSRLPTLALLQPSTLSVIIADKTDVSFKRVSHKSNVPEAIADAHVLVNLLVARSTIRRVKGTTGRFQWTVDFKPKFDPLHVNLFSELLKATGRVKFPQEWQNIYESAKIEYLFVFHSTFLNTYLSRLYFAMRAVFAMYRSVDQFEFIIDDAERGISLKRVFTPDDYHEKIFTLGKHFYQKGWVGSYLHKALEQQLEFGSKL